MSRILFFVSCFLVLGIVSCSSDNASNTQNHAPLSKTDSLQILSSILAAMKEEMYEDIYVITNLDTTSINDNPFGIPYCGSNFTLHIRRNSQNELMIGDELISDLSHVSQRIVEYFSWNEDGNDLNSPFPLFSRATKQEISDNLNRVKQELSEIKKDTAATTDMIQFKKRQVEEWELKLRVIKTLGLEELPEVHSKAAVEIECQQRTSTKYHDQVLDSMMIGYYYLRERHAQRYFRESYVRIFKRQLEHPNSADCAKLEALALLNQLKVIDHASLKKYRHIFPMPYHPIPPPAQ